MRALVLCVAVLLASGAAARPRTPAPVEADRGKVRARDKGKLREVPEPGGRVVGKVRPRERLDFLERSPDGRWAQVRKKRIRGWIEADALEGLPPPVTAPPATPAVAAPPPPDPGPPGPDAPSAAPPPAPQGLAPMDHFALGNAHYERGEYDQAVARFEEGYRADRDPAYLYNIAQAQRLAGRPLQAIDAYRRYLAAAPQADNRADVEQHIAALDRELRAADAFSLAKEGRTAVKEGRTAEGLAKLEEARRRAEEARLEAPDLAEVEYVYGLALLRARREQDAVAALSRATRLNPKDADMQLDLAVALQRIGDDDRARAAAQAALELGLKGDDRRSAETILQEARARRLHDRFTIDAAVTVAFDSNVLQGVRETIAGRFTGGARASLPTVAAREGVRTIIQDIRQQYLTPTPTRSEMDLPISLYLDLAGRLVGARRAQLWAEYHFSQVLMTLPTSVTGSDHDIYNFQEHRATLRLRTQLASWLQLAARAEGFANFSGLRDFEPFQGGIHGGIEATFRETAKLQTRLSYTHQYRASFDRSVSAFTNECGQTVTDTDTIFDGNRDDLGLIQELRLPWLRGRLGYQLHSDLTGTLLVDQPYHYTVPSTGQETVLGCYNYRAPLSYLGHEGLVSSRFLLPLKFELFAGLRYENRAYRGLYGAVFHPNRPVAADQSLGFIPRSDHRISVDVSASKALPKGFEVEASYSFVKNISNIQNGIDNRNYDKHVATLWLTYAF